MLLHGALRPRPLVPFEGYLPRLNDGAVCRPVLRRRRCLTLRTRRKAGGRHPAPGSVLAALLPVVILVGAPAARHAAARSHHAAQKRRRSVTPNMRGKPGWPASVPPPLSY